jgi:hypothetical protein
MTIGDFGPLTSRPGPNTGTTAVRTVSTNRDPVAAAPETNTNEPLVSLSEEALARLRQDPDGQDLDGQNLGGQNLGGQGQNSGQDQAGERMDAFIGNFYKHFSLFNSEKDRRETAEEDREHAHGHGDDGDLRDPIKEPTRKTIGIALTLGEIEVTLKAMKSQKQREEERRLHKHDD